MQTFAEVHEDTVALEKFLAATTPGQSASYVEIEQATGVRMDAKGRARLRTAARRASKIYTIQRNLGIVLSSPENAHGIMTHGLQRLSNHTVRQEKVTTGLLHQHAEGMDASERNHMSAVAAMFATVRVLAKNHQRAITEEARKRERLLGPSVIT